MKNSARLKLRPSAKVSESIVSTRALRIALSAGEPAGIGPELIARAIERGADGAQLVYVGDPSLLEAASRVVRTGFKIERFDAAYFGPMPPATVYFVPQKLAQANEFGFLRLGNAHYVLSVLQRIAAGCQSGEFDAMVTGPVVSLHGIPLADHGDPCLVGRQIFLRRDESAESRS